MKEEPHAANSRLASCGVTCLNLSTVVRNPARPASGKSLSAKMYHDKY